MLNWNAIYKSGRDFAVLSESTIEFIIQHTSSNASKTLLDIGCGTGLLTRQLQDKGYSCTGIDPSSEAIKIARSRSTQVTYKVADVQNDDFELHAYGLITCKDVYTFIDNKQQFLARIIELIEAHGTFILVTPLLPNVAPEKKGIAVDEQQLRRDLKMHFHIRASKPLPYGRLFILQPKR